MHEIAIAQTLCDTALAALPVDDQPARPISVVHVRLGPLAGVSKEELVFGFEVVSTGTRFDGARLEIEETPAVIVCDACHAQSELDEPELMICPRCGAASVRVVQGKELTLQSLELANEPA